MNEKIIPSRNEIIVKKYALIKNFILYSMIVFILTGVLLSAIVSNHIREDKLENAKIATQLTLSSILRDNLSETDFNDPINDAKKSKILNRIYETMNFYKPRSVVILNSAKATILSNETYDNEGMLINDTYIDDILNNSEPYFVSAPYKSIDGVVVFNIYMAIKYADVTTGVSVFQLTNSEISLHVNELVRQIATTLAGGFFILFLLLIKKLYTTSRSLLKQNIELSKQKSRLEMSYKSTVSALSNAIDARDPYTAGHSCRVTNISLLMGNAIGLSADELQNLEYAALFHDIGKLGIPEDILYKTGKLTPEEYEIIKDHTIVGVNILKTINFLIDGLPIIRNHHERYDGNGYPDKLKGENIPLGARILAIADTYDAMTSDRPYRKALSHEIAMQELIKNKGIQFDENFVDIFFKIESNIRNGGC